MSEKQGFDQEYGEPVAEQGRVSEARLSLRVNVGIVGILFHQDILSSPALLILFLRKCPSYKDHSDLAEQSDQSLR
jgi:hypothetical protein